ncbi:tetratricopeptide repeat protein [bacterium]|nr:tetratricopeptide repeat protein [bacterium]
MKKIIILILMSLFFCTENFAQTQKEIFEDGVICFKKGQYQNAIDAFSKLIELAPDHADAFKNRGVSYMKQGKFDLAIKDFETAIKLFPELKGLYSNFGVAWYHKKEYAKAIENYDLELEMSPENHLAYFNRALCLAELDKNDQALEDLEKTLNLKPDFYWAICYKADLLVEKGDVINAKAVYKQAIKYAHKNTYAKKKLGQLNKTIETDKKNYSPDPELDKPVRTEKTQEPSRVIAQHDSGYAIQAGAFISQSNASKLQKKLSGMGFDSRILNLKDSADKTWYIVRSGKYTDKKKAQKECALLKKKLGSQPLIRPIGKW